MSSTAPPRLSRQSATLLLTGVIFVSVVGYLIGTEDKSRHLQGSYALLSRDEPPVDPAAIDSSSTVMPAVEYSEMRRRGTGRMFGSHVAVSRDEPAVNTALVAGLLTSTPAVNYAEMRRRKTGPTSKWQPSLPRLSTGYDFLRCVTCHDPHSIEVRTSDEDKRRSLAVRSTRRAYNGAPPIIPHAIERTNDAACYACHDQGAVIGELVANRMSHGFMVNCLQCHAAPPPKPFADIEVVDTNTFAGLPAPTRGERAFANAPPEIPHSTWMRQRCLSCHGGATGWPGLEVTHRWRTNCLQCHVTSAQMEQAVAANSIGRMSELTGQEP